MPESAIRAERFDSSAASSSPSYAWEISGKPVAVHIGLDLVDRLEHEVVENFRSLNSRGSEIGGVLLGSFQTGTPLRVLIENYELIACDYSRGPLYRFSEADVERFDSTVQQRSAAGGLRVVGFFRSHTRKGLSLDAEDVAFFSGHFRDAHQVALLIRPYASKPSTAGIFIWEGGSLRSESSYQEFSFRRSVLERGPGHDQPAANEDLTAGPAPSPAPEPAITKPATRAQIVPIASRREITLPQHSPERLSAEVEMPSIADPPHATIEKAIPTYKTTVADKPLPPQKTPIPEKLLSTPMTAVPEKALSTQKTPVPEKALSAQKTPVPEKAVPVVKTPASEEAAPFTEWASDQDAEETAGLVLGTGWMARGKLMYIAGGAAVALLLLSGMLVYPALGHKPKSAAVPGGRDHGLALHVERSAGELLLTWNRDSEAVLNATHAVLSITDGEQHDNVDVDLPQLRNGSIVYAPSGTDIVFQLALVEKDATKIQSESVQVLRTRPSPMPDGAQNGADKTPVATIRPAANSTAVVTAEIPVPQPEQNADVKASTALPPAPAPAPLKPFPTETLSQRLRPARPSDLPDAPGLAKNEPAAVALPGNSFLTAGPGVPQPPPHVAPVKTGGRVQQAELLVRTNPEYPMAARTAHVQGNVVVSAIVAADGRIKSVKAISGPALLEPAAVAAVKQWTYKPAILNGTPVESESRVELRFTLDR